MIHGNIPQTSRSTRQLSKDYLYKGSDCSASMKSTSRSRLVSSNETPETITLRKEIVQLRKNLTNANQELEEIKTNHNNEIHQLKSTLEEMKKEIQTLITEKSENIALQSYGIDEYRSLAQEVIKLRTEVDRLKDPRNKRSVK